MRPPSHPSKLGLYVQTGFREYEHYVVSDKYSNVIGTFTRQSKLKTKCILII